MNQEIQSLEKQLVRLKNRLAEARQNVAPESVHDYTLKTPDGADVLLSELFEDKSDLLVVHNMGKECPYCTLWADGFNGVVEHLLSRASFVVCSYDEAAALKEFAASRNWKFRTVSNEGSDFACDMGFVIDGKPWPGVSAFHKAENGSMTRTGKATFHPSDDFCAIWHLFDLLYQGHGAWTPKLDY